MLTKEQLLAPVQIDLSMQIADKGSAVMVTNVSAVVLQAVLILTQIPKPLLARAIHEMETDKNVFNKPEDKQSVQLLIAVQDFLKRGAELSRQLPSTEQPSRLIVLPDGK